MTGGSTASEKGLGCAHVVVLYVDDIVAREARHYKNKTLETLRAPHDNYGGIVVIPAANEYAQKAEVLAALLRAATCKEMVVKLPAAPEHDIAAALKASCARVNHWVCVTSEDMTTQLLRKAA